MPKDDDDDDDDDDEGANDSAGAIASESPRRVEARVGDLRADAAADDVGEPIGPPEEEEDE